MQDKEAIGEAEEALTGKSEISNDYQDSLDKRDSFEGHGKKEKEPTKEGKFAFKKMKQPRKEKPDKNSPSRFQGEGVTFKAKLIGCEPVKEARGDKMCQDSMQRLKKNVRNAGPHKMKIVVCVSLQGIKIKEEKSGTVIYHHPVSLISFISQDITDARAFGYVFGSVDEPHQFIAIKTEKPAFHVVLAIRDLFQTVLNYKKEEIDNAKENKNDNQTEKTKEMENIQRKTSEKETLNSTSSEQKPNNENIYFEVLLTEPLKMKDESDAFESPKEVTEPVKTIDDLLGLQDELNKLQQGIEQMDTSIAVAASFNIGASSPENDPFDTSFVLGPKRDSFPLPMPTPIQLATCASSSESQQSSNNDKYAVFSTLDSTPSIFEKTSPESTTGGADVTSAIPDIKDLEEEIQKKSSAPPKPPRHSKSSSPDQSVFADLDPLGKDRPYKDKTEFFQDVKNPPKKVLNDLVDKSEDGSRSFDNSLMSPPVVFPGAFESMSPPAYTPSPNPLSSSLPNSFHVNPKLSLAYVQNNPYNPFENVEKDNMAGTNSSILTNQASEREPTFPVSHSPHSKLFPQNGVSNGTSHLGKSPPSGAVLASVYQQLTINCNTANTNGNHIFQQTSSSPIPIPPRQIGLDKDRSVSNGSIGSPYSKSPVSYSSGSPNQTDYFGSQNTCSEGYSPVGLSIKNILNTPSNGENKLNLILNGNTNKSHLTNGSSNISSKSNNNSSLQNGVSRPRPRPSLSKGNSVPSNGYSLSSQSSCSDSSTDSETISRENMQSIANVLLTNGHRLRAQSLCFESRKDFQLQLPENDKSYGKNRDSGVCLILVQSRYVYKDERARRVTICNSHQENERKFLRILDKRFPEL